MFSVQQKYQTGSLLIYIIVLMFIFSMIMTGLLAYATTQIKLVRGTVNNEQAFEIAEAGANYYEWHLAHWTTDYTDGSGTSTCTSCGPYVHAYTDQDTGRALGVFSLTVTPPTIGSTVVTVQSTGYTYTNPNQKRTVTVKYGIPSLAQYAFLTNSDAWIGDNENVSGEFMTNGGLRFDGTGNAPIMSAKQTYTCQGWSGSPCPQTENGIWGNAPQATKNYWQYPVSNVDFSSITANLATMKTNAQQNGIYLPPSNVQGYSLVFQSNGTVSIYKVTSLKSGEPVGYDVNNTAHNTSIDYNARTLLYTKPIPPNGIIYVEDNVWVEGTLKGRAMVAAAVLPYNASNAPSIMVPNNIVYTAKDGTSCLGLLAQQDVLVTYNSPANLEIDAALIAQNGSAQLYYYPGYVKNTITIYGSTASYGTWTWSWVDGSNNIVSGYANTNTIYDSNLLFSPPPSFPLSSSGYQQMSWSSD